MRSLKLISGCYVGLDNHHRLHSQLVPDIASVSFKLAQLTVESEQPNFGPVSPHFAEITSSSTDLSTLLPSCGPFDTVTSRSERQDHFGSDFVVIWATGPPCPLPCSDCALLRWVADAPMTRIYPELPRNPRPHLGATLPRWV